MGKIIHDNFVVEAQCDTGFGKTRVVRKQWDSPIDVSGRSNHHHLELSLLPINAVAKGCFTDHWSPHRFEPFGEMFMLPARQTVRALSDCRSQNSIVCDLDPESISRWIEVDFNWTDSRLQRTLNISSQRMRGLLFQIGEEIRNPGFACETMVELMTAQVVIELARYLKSIDEEKTTGGLSPWRLKLIEQRVSDVTTQPSLTELAELCNLSVRHLTRAFRKSVGRSLGSYIAEKRIGHAKRLIASGMSIKSVAYTMGFSAPSNFTASFVRGTGETPREYRLRACGGSADVTVTRGHTH